MTPTHDHHATPPPRGSGTSTRRRVFRATLAAFVGLLVLGTALSIALMWPSADRVAPGAGVSDPGGEIVSARVTDVALAPCTTPGAAAASAASAPDSPTGAHTAPPPGADDCVEVRAELPIGKPVEFTIRGPAARGVALAPGDAVRLIAHEVVLDGTAEVNYSFYDVPRGGKLLTIAIVFALIVITVGRWRGAMALLGVGAATTLLVLFILPAILAGKPPVLVAVVGATGIMVIVLYLAHGLTHRTTAALFGSLFGILFTAVAGFGVTRWLRFTGVSSTDDASLVIAVPTLQMNDVLTATIVIAGLGILNDITVAQASSVWEMRSLNPGLPQRQLYLSAMRVGRDHIASSIYTLVFAYAGAMLVMLLLLTTYPRDLIELVTSEQIGQEIVRTLIGAAGLVLAMPVTTACAVLFAAPPETDHGPARNPSAPFWRGNTAG
ncbi:YibE/F family protein [Leucobacter luti]|uniref:YibE/F-like protein n=1 Tax=Leucobacter luti TaxID=340320 RepID=A0A4V6MBY6_9MICO|nr:YibE/F family protein [Leucobacter luti]RZT62699.1 YibE/F-like protein [Leucobacter luti]